MAITLDTTYTGTATNSYVELAEAEALVLQLAALAGLGVSTSGWTALTSPSAEAKKFALTTAADRIDNAKFPGYKYMQTQRRAFPRELTGITWANYGGDGGTYPDAVKLAQVAEACWLLSTPPDSQQHAEQGIRSETIGDSTVVYDDSRKVSITGQPISAPAMRILTGAGLTSPGGGSVYVPRG